MRTKGLFIIVDGPSASGNDSVIQQVLKDLYTLGIQALSIQETRERDYNREKILSAKNFGDKKTAEAIINERVKIYQTKIIPQLSDGRFMIANRGETTTLAYQTIGKEMVMEDVWKMHRNANIPLPDLVIILNCSVEEALRREILKKTSDNNKDKNSLSGNFTQNFERRKQIHTHYERVKDFLEKKGIAVIYLKTDVMDVQEGSREIVDFIKNKLNYMHE